MSLINLFRRKDRELLADIGFVPGLVDASLRVTCAKDEIDGRLEVVCWKCGGADGIFDPERSIDVPRNDAGVWVRLHRRCV